VEAAPQVLRLDTKDVADVQEREDPRAVGALDPVLGVLEELLAACVTRARELAVHIHRVFQHRDHQAALAVVLRPPGDPVEVLRRQDGVGHEQLGHPLLRSSGDVSISHGFVLENVSLKTTVDDWLRR
jgi:hypothetical protein